MYVIVLGCGRVGARVATMLDAEGHDVVIIDQKQEAFQRLPADFHGTTMLGTGIDEEMLRHAGIERADAFAALTQGDNTNIMAAQLAQTIFHVPNVITRIYDPLREETYHLLGLETICPTTIAAAMVKERIERNAAKKPVVDATPSGQATGG